MYSYFTGYGNETPNPRDILGAIFGTILIIVLSAIVSSCKVQSISCSHENDSIVTKTEYKWDSVYIDRWHTKEIKGDTIYIHDSIFQDRWHKAEKADTVYIDKEQTIVQEVKYIPDFYKGSTIALWVLIAAIVVYVVIRVVKAIYLRR